MAMLKRCGIIVAAVSAVYASGVVASSPSLSYSVSWNSSPFPSASVRLLSSDRLMTETWAAGQGLLRSTRAVYTFAVNTIDYKVSLMRYDPNSEEYYNTRDQVHMRTAKRILKLCETNRGFYIKAGQFIASMQHVPKEFVQTLSVLQDKVWFMAPITLGIYVLQSYRLVLLRNDHLRQNLLCLTGELLAIQVNGAGFPGGVWEKC
jgi:hypothetical protein